MMATMGQDWGRLGKALAGARAAAGWTQAELAERIGVTRTAVQSVERGVKRAKVTGTMRSYAHVVGWSETSIEQVLAGGEPVHGGAEAAGELPLRIVEALRAEGPLLDAAVLNLPDNEDPQGRIVVVVKGRPDITPDQLKQALSAWERTHDALRDVTRGDNG